MLPPPSGTLLVAWIVLALVLVGLGTLVRRLGRVPAAAGTDPFLDFWTGWAALTVVLEAWHLVLPIDTGALAFVASLGLLGLATDGRRPWRALVRGARAHPFVVAAVLVAALWLSRLCLAGARNGDSGYYHFPIMRWAATFPAVPGLVNLFPFLAYNQSFLLYATVVNVGPLAQAGNHVANGILVLALLARCTLGLARAVQADASGAPADLYYALLLPAAFGLAFDINLTSPSPDLAVFALEAVLCGALVAFLTERRDAPARRLAAACALLAAVGVTVKLSFAGLAAAVLPLVLVVVMRRAASARAALTVIVLATLAVVPWVVHGVVLSGYPLYPSPVMPLPVVWRAPLAATIAQGNAIREWNGVADAWRVALGDPRWFAGLLGTLGWTQRDVLLALAIVAVALPVAAGRCVWTRRVPVLALALVPTVAGLVFVFVAAPQARFAGALPWVLAEESVLLVASWNGAGRRRARTVLAGVAVALAALHLRDGPVFRRDLAGFEGLPSPELREVRIADGLAVQVPVPSDQCWDAPPPCTPVPNRALRLRREGDLGAGFVIDGNVEPGPP